MANPTLNENTFNNNETVYISANEVMTANGTVMKSAFLLLITILGAAFSWKTFMVGNISLVNMLMTIGIIAGLILALIISFKQTTAPMLAPIYAACEGLALGGISAMFEAQLPGIVFQAILGTFATMFTMLALYMGRVIQVTDKLRSVIFVSTATVAVFYLAQFILGFFGVNMTASLPPHFMIGINVLVIIVAALNFLTDFSIIERGVDFHAPKYFEWYCSFGLLVTLVWLYLEILKLLSRLNRR